MHMGWLPFLVQLYGIWSTLGSAFRAVLCTCFIYDLWAAAATCAAAPSGQGPSTPPSGMIVWCCPCSLPLTSSYCSLPMATCFLLLWIGFWDCWFWVNWVYYFSYRVPDVFQENFCSFLYVWNSGCFCWILIVSNLGWLWPCWYLMVNPELSF